MPYKSEKQRRLMHAKHPEIAARWDAEYGTKVKKGAKFDAWRDRETGRNREPFIVTGAKKLRRKKVTKSVALGPRAALNTKRLVAVARNPVKGVGVPTQRRTDAARKASRSSAFFAGANKGRVSKSAWGVVHKGSPDQSALHMPGSTMTVPKRRLRKVKRKRTAEI